MKTNTIKQIVRETFESMPGTFNTVDFIATVKTHCSVRINKFPFDSTILRQLRELRADDPMTYDWQCIDKVKSVYQKIEWKTVSYTEIPQFHGTLTELNNLCEIKKPIERKSYIYNLPKSTIGGGNYINELKGYSPENNLPKQNIFQKLFKIK